mmetsp:Transcript_31703/g.49579  ORF Transcript_31703/g.49579 Transcript_31703/m.49579 type:complete len:204 (+) Transcript_31703:258-869(+)
MIFCPYHSIHFDQGMTDCGICCAKYNCFACTFACCLNPCCWLYCPIEHSARIILDLFVPCNHGDDKIRQYCNPHTGVLCLGKETNIVRYKNNSGCQCKELPEEYQGFPADVYVINCCCEKKCVCYNRCVNHMLLPACCTNCCQDSCLWCCNCRCCYEPYEDYSGIELVLRNSEEVTKELHTTQQKKFAERQSTLRLDQAEKQK